MINRQRLSFVLVLGLVATLMALRIYTEADTLSLDFTPRYVPAQAALMGQSAYSDVVTTQSQIAYYGAPATADMDQHRFGYPAYSLFVYGALTVLPLRAAALVWMVAQVALCLWMLHLHGVGVWKALALIVLLREPLVALLIGQSVLWSVAWIGLALWTLERARHPQAAVAFALAALQPTITVPLALVVLLRYPHALRVYVLIMTGVVGASVVVFGWWIPDWLHGLTAYAGYVSYMVWIAPLLPLVIPFALGGGLWAALPSTPLWERAGLGLAALVLLLPLTGLYHLALFLPMLVRQSWRWSLVIGVVAWGMSIFPFELRIVEVLAVAGVVAWVSLPAVPKLVRTRHISSA